MRWSHFVACTTPSAAKATSMRPLDATKPRKACDFLVETALHRRSGSTGARHTSTAAVAAGRASATPRYPPQPMHPHQPRPTATANAATCPVKTNDLIIVLLSLCTPSGRGPATLCQTIRIGTRGFSREQHNQAGGSGQHADQKTKRCQPSRPQPTISPPPNKTGQQNHEGHSNPPREPLCYPRRYLHHTPPCPYDSSRHPAGITPGPAECRGGADRRGRSVRCPKPPAPQEKVKRGLRLPFQT